MRTWIQMSIIVLLILSLDWAASRELQRVTGQMGEQARTLTEAVDGEEWGQARITYEEMAAYWEEKRPGLQKYIDHGELENVDILMTRVEAMLPGGDREELLPELSELSRDIAHLTQRYEMALENIF